MDTAITGKGQATIPKAIREHLGLRPGDRVKFFVHPDGSMAAWCCCQNLAFQRYEASPDRNGVQ